MKRRFGLGWRGCKTSNWALHPILGPTELILQSLNRSHRQLVNGFDAIGGDKRDLGHFNMLVHELELFALSTTSPNPFSAGS